MHSEPPDRQEAGGTDFVLSSLPGAVFLLGPPAETEGIVQRLEGEGCRCRSFDEPEAFLDATFNEPPWAVVCWESRFSLPAAELHQILRHHLDWRACAMIVVRGAEGPGGELASSARAVIDGPVDPGMISQLLADLSRDRASFGGEIPRILVVDDDQNIVLLGSHIVSALGMIPLVAFDGVQALDKARKLRPDLILLDINMPVMDGFEVIEALKADASTNLIPIIVFSARKREEDKVRALQLGADDYVTKPFSITELSARIERLLKRTRTGVSASSTTGLPGSVSIEQVLGDRVLSRVPLGVLYMDLDDFKAFNDHYGFSRGDSLIRQTADIILEAVRELGNADDFVGHIGGDDFIVVTTPEAAVPIAETVIERFDRIIPYYYDRADRCRRGIEVEDRKGVRTRFPFMSLSIAIVTNEGKEFHHAAQIADVAAQLKKYAKRRAGSLWVKDQRGDGGRKE